MKHVAGLILARGGSKGITLKNLAPVRGHSLLVWALSAATRCQGFDSVWVSSDHDEILKVASEHGARLHRRSARTSTDDASSLDAISEFLDDHPEVDAIGLMQCTSPFVRVEHLEEAARLIREASFDSAFSASRSHSLRWTADNKGDAGMRAINFDPARRPRRQDWDGEFVENGAFYFSAVHLLKRGVIQGGRIAAVEMSQECSLDIDTPYDLWLAEQHAAYFDLHPAGSAPTAHRQSASDSVQ